MATAGQICPRCTANNLRTARQCEVCGAPLPGVEPERPSFNPPPSELAMEFVPPEERRSARDFESEAEAELAAGYLRSHGMPAEVGKLMIPGLPFLVALWVRKDDLATARKLLADADRRARGPQPVE